MRVGDLVRYKGVYDGTLSTIGVVVGKCSMIGSDNYFYIQWANGEKFPESRLYLELVIL
jgi:hypothetical protein